MLDIPKARKIIEAATAGPWKIFIGDWRVVNFDNYPICGTSNVLGQDEQNATFIAFAREALPQALDEIELLRMQQVGYVEALGERDANLEALLVTLRKENDDLKDQRRRFWSDEVEDLRKRLELAEAVCHAADTFLFFGTDNSNPACALRARIRDWRQESKCEKGDEG